MKDTGKREVVWRSMDGKCAGETEKPGCRRKSIWDSGFKSMLWFRERLLEAPKITSIGIENSEPQRPCVQKCNTLFLYD